MKKKIVGIKDGKIYRIKEEYQDEDKEKLHLVKMDQTEKLPKEEMTRFKARKLVEDKEKTYFVIRRGPQYREKKVELVNELSSAMIADGSWKDVEFKAFNPKAKGRDIENGNLHVLMKTKQQFVDVLVEMGFEEMQTDRYV